MTIAYIVPGTLSGFFAALVALVSGSGLLLAFVAYVIGGMLGMTAVILWMLSSPRVTRSKHAATKRI